MGSDESNFYVLSIVRDKVTRQCPQTTTFEEKVESKRIRTKVPLLTARPNRLTGKEKQRERQKGMRRRRRRRNGKEPKTRDS